MMAQRVQHRNAKLSILTPEQREKAEKLWDMRGDHHGKRGFSPDCDRECGKEQALVAATTADHTSVKQSGFFDQEARLPVCCPTHLSLRFTSIIPSHTANRYSIKLENLKSDINYI